MEKQECINCRGDGINPDVELSGETICPLCEGKGFINKQYSTQSDKKIKYTYADLMGGAADEPRSGIDVRYLIPKKKTKQK